MAWALCASVEQDFYGIQGDLLNRVPVLHAETQAPKCTPLLYLCSTSYTSSMLRLGSDLSSRSQDPKVQLTGKKKVRCWQGCVYSEQQWAGGIKEWPVSIEHHWAGGSEVSDAAFCSFDKNLAVPLVRVFWKLKWKVWGRKNWDSKRFLVFNVTRFLNLIYLTSKHHTAVTWVQKCSWYLHET